MEKIIKLVSFVCVCVCVCVCVLSIITTEPPRVNTATELFKQWKDNKTGKLFFVLSIITTEPPRVDTATELLKE